MDAEVQGFIVLLDEVNTGIREMIQKIGDQGITWSPRIPETNPLRCW